MPVAIALKLYDANIDVVTSLIDRI